MDNDDTTFAPRKGMTVIGSDGKRVGAIDLVKDTYFIVKHGVFPHDHYISRTAIASHDDDTVYLALPADDALERGFVNPGVAYSGDEGDAVTGHDDVVEPAIDADMDADAPVAAEAGIPLADAAEADETVASQEPGGVEDVAGDEPLEESSGVANQESAVVEDATRDEPAETDLADHEEDAHRTIELHKEELSVTTRPVERGVVRAAKKVVEEKVTLDVPVVEEEVVVTRRRVDGEIAGDDYVFEEGTIDIPLQGQDVEIEKQAKVVEEIDIDKTAHQRVREVTETVRRETARVEGADNPDAADPATDSEER